MSNISNISVFEKCFSLINLKEFRCPTSDTYAKKLLSGQAILLFLDAILHKRTSLEDMADQLKSKEDLQEYLQLKDISASSLCRKLSCLPTPLLRRLTFSMLEKVRLKKSKVDVFSLGKLGLIDSTEISLPKKAGEWAYCQKDKNAIKIHLLYTVFNEETSLVDSFVSSTAAVSDQEIAPYLMMDKDTTYVMDRGYINYKLYQQWIMEEVRFVARIKANNRTKILENYAVKEGSIVTRDALVKIKVTNSEEFFEARLVEYKDIEGNNYRVVSNRWDLSAEEIAEIYRQRWAIEIFFKWLKQNLSTIHWYSYKPEAVWNQIYLTFIAYAICELIKVELQVSKKPLSVILKKLRHYWFDSWWVLTELITKPPEKKSKGRRKKGRPGRPRKYPKKLKAVKLIDPII